MTASARMRSLSEGIAPRQVAIDRGMTPAAALDFAESLARFIDADMLYRRMDDASEAAKSS